MIFILLYFVIRQQIDFIFIFFLSFLFWKIFTIVINRYRAKGCGHQVGGWILCRLKNKRKTFLHTKGKKKKKKKKKGGALI